VGTGENLIGFQPGDRITLRDLLYAALVQSDNVAAYNPCQPGRHRVATGCPRGRDGTPVAIFVGQMNVLAKSLRMDRTRFVNPHGIDTGERSVPFSTAYDLSRLTRYAMNKPAFRFYVAQKERQISFNRGSQKKGYLLRNTNELLGTNAWMGVKTGKTARAGDCLILSAHREAEIRKDGARKVVTPRGLVIVMLGSANRFSEGRAASGPWLAAYDQWAAGGRMWTRRRRSDFLPAHMTKPRIGVLTSGGDCPGLNAVLRGVVLAAKSLAGKCSGFLMASRIAPARQL